MILSIMGAAFAEAEPSDSNSAAARTEADFLKFNFENTGFIM
jgi:hypothetical protein